MNGVDKSATDMKGLWEKEPKRNDRNEVSRMNMNERIARINELYHKSQKEGLTEEEKAEQAKLRREYVESVRNNLRGQLDQITIENADGSRVNLGEKYGRKHD